MTYLGNYLDLCMMKNPGVQMLLVQLIGVSN